MKSKDKLNEEKKLVLTGTIVEEHPEMLYTVSAIFEHKDGAGNILKEFPIKVECKVSGKMKKSLIRLKKGDDVQIEVSLYNLQLGTIIYRNTKRIIEI